MDLLDTDSECVQCKWCDMEWTYWTQTVSVYSVNGVIWSVLDTVSGYSVNGVIWNGLTGHSECVQCKWCDMECTGH